MKCLLNNQFAPLTYKWGFLQAPLGAVSDALFEWHVSLLSNIDPYTVLNVKLPFKWRQPPRGGIDRELVEQPLPLALHYLEPLTLFPAKELLLATRSSWTAYFDNGVRGGDPFGPISHLAQAIKCRGITVTCIPGKQEPAVPGPWGAVTFELFAPEQREWLNRERSIRVWEDQGIWEFRASGSIQPFEKPEYYEAMAIKDRFTPELLEEYCAALGIHLFEVGFYSPQGVVITNHDALLLPNNESCSLSQAQRRLGFQP